MSECHRIGQTDLSPVGAADPALAQGPARNVVLDAVDAHVLTDLLFLSARHVDCFLSPSASALEPKVCALINYAPGAAAHL